MEGEASRKKQTILDVHEVWRTMLPDPGRAVTLTVQQETRAPGESDSSERAKFETET